MIYRKETPFDQLSFECLLLLENSLRLVNPFFIDPYLTQDTRKEIVAALKSKIQRNPQYFKLEDYGIEDC